MVVVAAALGFAHPAHADSPDAPDTSTVPTVTAPDPSALVDAAATAAQGGATNVSVSVRIGSPGDNGDVSQAITVSTGSQAQSTGAGSQQNTTTQTQSTQTGSANVSISVRINSPGSDGTVSQTSSAGANASSSTSTQYQPPATQYPAPRKLETPSTPTAPPAPAAQQEPSPAPDPAPAQPVTSGPSTWVWNLTVSGCGDTNLGDITKVIDTGIQGWIWNWNIETICQPSTPTTPINPPESGGGISPPSLPAPDPPTPPSVVPPQVLVLPRVPQPVIAAPPPVAVVVPVLGPIELPALLKPALLRPAALTPVALPDPLLLPQSLGLFAPIKARHARRHVHAAPAPRAHVLVAAVTLRAPLTTVATTKPVRDAHTASHRTASHKAPPPWETLSLILDSAFAPAPAGASAAGGGGAGSGAVAALSLWLLLQLPGFVYLRLPARQRRPRGPVDDKLTRPG